MSQADRVAVQFALMNRRAFVVVKKLDGIFDGNDVIIFLAIDAVDQYRESGRLS